MAYLGDGMRWKYRIRALLDPRNWWLEAKFRWSRMRRGWGEPDVWSLDDFLADLIADTVAHLNSTNFAYPADISAEEWSTILSEIEHGFRQYRQLQYGYPFEDGMTEEQLQADFDRAFDLFREWFRALWW